MIIDKDNCFEVGNRAMASVLLLYYHLISDDGFFHGQTVFVNHNDFNAHEFIDVKVIEAPNVTLDINESMLREGAVICLLCMLFDMFCENEEDDYPSNDEEMIKILKEHGIQVIPEISAYLECILVPANKLDFDLYNDILKSIYEKYVKGFLIKLVA